LRAARANRVFCTDEKRIRTENTVLVNTKQGVRGLYKINHRSSMYPPASADVGARALRAARANHVFCTDEKRIRTENTVIVNTKRGVGGLYKIEPLKIGGDLRRHT